MTVTAPPSKFFWDLSPDGSRIAYGEFRMRGDDYVTVLKIDDQTEKRWPMSGWSRFSSLAWSVDGNALFVTTSRAEGSDLLRVSLLDGKVAPLRLGEAGRWFLNPRPSPDGKRLAYAIRTTDSNVWLIQTK
jgi:Tol biopolymer transport system component